MSVENQKMDYVPEHEDFQIMKKIYLPKMLKLPKGLWNQAFQFLKDVLILTYGRCQFGLLVDAVDQNPFEEAKKISQNFTKIAEMNEWSEKTIISVISNTKKIMKQTTININFINKLTTVKGKGIDRNSLEYCLPGRLKKCGDDNPERRLVLQWLEKCKKNTRNKSQSSLRQIIQFTLKVCNGLNLDLNNFDEEMAKKIPLSTFKKIVDEINLKIAKKTKVRFCIIVIENFLKCDISHSALEEWTKSTPKEEKSCVEDRNLNRMTKRDLESMFEAAASNVRDSVLFLLMTTTDLRVSFVSNLVLDNVATEVDGEFTILKEGRTLEKGKRWFTFPICKKLKTFLEKWIIEERNVLSEYLFPGSKQGSLSPSRISKIIKEISTRAGLDCKQIHAHSLRQSFLREAENDPQFIKKITGHSTLKEIFLKESALEASKRYNIPWLIKKDSKTKLKVASTVKKN